MGNQDQKCSHKTLQANCKHCNSLKKQWYSKLAKEGFDDIEYGRDTVAIQAQNSAVELKTLLYQPVNLKSINPYSTAYYDAVWSVYHSWVAQGRSKRDCTVVELLARQEGDTGTNRGIAAKLKELGLKPWSRRFVEITLKEINQLIPEHAAK